MMPRLRAGAGSTRRATTDPEPKAELVGVVLDFAELAGDDPGVGRAPFDAIETAAAFEDVHFGAFGGDAAVAVFLRREGAAAFVEEARFGDDHDGERRGLAEVARARGEAPAETEEQ